MVSLLLATIHSAPIKLQGARPPGPPAGCRDNSLANIIVFQYASSEHLTSVFCWMNYLQECCLKGGHILGFLNKWGFNLKDTWFHIPFAK